jgi:hypothetical protein
LHELKWSTSLGVNTNIFDLHDPKSWYINQLIQILYVHRYVETWDEGVLVSREQLDSDNGGG